MAKAENIAWRFINHLKLVKKSKFAQWIFCHQEACRWL